MLGAGAGVLLDTPQVVHGCAHLLAHVLHSLVDAGPVHLAGDKEPFELSALFLAHGGEPARFPALCRSAVVPGIAGSLRYAVANMGAFFFKVPPTVCSSPRFPRRSALHWTWPFRKWRTNPPYPF